MFILILPHYHLFGLRSVIPCEGPGLYIQTFHLLLSSFLVSNQYAVSPRPTSRFVDVCALCRYQLPSNAFPGFRFTSVPIISLCVFLSNHVLARPGNRWPYAHIVSYMAPSSTTNFHLTSNLLGLAQFLPHTPFTTNPWLLIPNRSLCFATVCYHNSLTTS